MNLITLQSESQSNPMFLINGGLPQLVQQEPMTPLTAASPLLARAVPTMECTRTQSDLQLSVDSPIRKSVGRCQHSEDSWNESSVMEPDSPKPKRGRPRKNASGQKRRDFKCDQCHRSYFTRAHLLNHMISHSDERPYACEVPNCGKRFKRIYSLNSHVKLHNEERQHQCQFPGCTKRFKSKNTLTWH